VHLENGQSYINSTEKPLETKPLPSRNNSDSFLQALSARQLCKNPSIYWSSNFLHLDRRDKMAKKNRQVNWRAIWPFELVMWLGGSTLCTQITESVSTCSCFYMKSIVHAPLKAWGQWRELCVSPFRMHADSEGFLMMANTRRRPYKKLLQPRWQDNWETTLLLRWSVVNCLTPEDFGRSSKMTCQKTFWT
jgi:hypothetical protein